ncbi:MAG: alpha/beta hydrolase [Planctomycetota bacterium]|jgi:S-formylglutathione hydrolase FrmB|nr:alpha/beta hydrolase [Planctomycetota bacterium]MDG2143682.1 alpha/beta hydrolase [Planctomycetota bacterium]
MQVPARDSLAFEGRVELPVLQSKLLDGGRYGDPTQRHVAVYLPPGAQESAPLPTIYLLPGFTGNYTNYLETHPWKEGVVKCYDRGVARGEYAPAILVMPDCFTKLGGSQFVNSSCLGRYEDYVTQEVPAFVDERYPTLGASRGVCGKSSGGFGAMRLAMRFPEIFPAAGSISGDVNFDQGYGVEFPAALRGLVAHDMDPQKFLDGFFQEPTLKGDDHAVLNTLAMAACYSPNPDAPLGFDLPFEMRAGKRIEAVWQRWLAFDPLQMVEAAAENLKRMKLLHLECGMLDQFHLQWGLRRLADKLTDLGVPHDHIEHAGSHFDINDRYPPLIDKLARALV